MVSAGPSGKTLGTLPADVGRGFEPPARTVLPFFFSVDSDTHSYGCSPSVAMMARYFAREDQA